MKTRFVAVAAALALTAFAGGASAATVVGAKSIRITNAFPDWLQVSEVVALDFANVDVALASNGGVATAADRYSTFYLPGADDGPENAIDGALPYAQAYAGPGYPGLPGIYHSGTTSSASYLDITFAGPANLSSLSIYGRTDCCDSRDLYNVDIRNAAGVSIFSGQIDARNSDHLGTLTFDAPTTSAAPEPAAWALMISGFGAAGAMLRRRRAAVA